MATTTMAFTTGQLVAFIIGLLGAILTILNIIDKYVALKEKNETPFKTLSVKVDDHETRIGKMELSLKFGGERFNEQDHTNEILLHSVLVLVESQITSMIQEGKPISKDLEQAKDDLHSFLSKR